MTNSFLAILLTICFSSGGNNDSQYQDTSFSDNLQEKTMNFEVDFLDVYKLKIGDTFLYGNYENFISDIGIPNKVTITKTDFPIMSKADLDKVIASAKNPNIVTLHYQGIDMWFTFDNSVIPSTIDFRKTDRSVTYGGTTFDTAYTLDQFKEQFSKSAKPSFTLPQSFFEITTKEKGANLEHYLLMRKSKDDPNATPMIEFTFDKGKLIFIVFANF